MDISFSEQDLQFQEEIRAGLNGSEFPSNVREKQEKGTALSKADMIDFHKFIHSKGWMGYNWPVEYGGTGWSPVCLLYTSPSPRDQRGSRMPSSA